MSLSLVRINYKTNFNQYPATYQTDASTFRINKSITSRINSYNKQLPNKTFLFSDAFPLSSSDYPSDDTDFLLLLKSPRDFYNILQKKKDDYKKKHGKKYKITKAQIKKYKYKEHNLKYIVERLFKLGKKMYLPGRDKYRPVTLTNYQYVPYNMAFGESKEKVLGKDLNVITVLLDLELSEEYRGSVGMDDLKKMDCKQKAKRIGNIWNSLKGNERKSFKKRDVKYNTPGMYKPSGGGRKRNKTRRNRKRNRKTKKRKSYKNKYKK